MFKNNTMKNSYIALIVFVFPMILKAQTNTFDPLRHNADVVESERKRAAMNLGFINTTAGQNYDQKYQRYRWTVNPTAQYIRGDVTTYFRATQLMNNLSFDFADNLQIDSIFQRRTPLSYNRTNNILTITLPTPIQNGALDSVTIYYQGAPVSTGFGSFTIARHGTANTPVLYTLSEPYGARDWYPVKQDLSDKIDSVDVIVTVPAGNRVASNGLLMSETPSPDATQTTFFWKHRYPIVFYLVGIAVTNYAQFTDRIPLVGRDTIDILNYMYPEDIAAAQTVNARFNVSQPMRVFDSTFAGYPFKREKYGHAQWNWGGGEEHQTMSFVTDLRNGELISHEMAHQWFGNKVTCCSYQDIWLNESFATWCTGWNYESYSSYYKDFWRILNNDAILTPTGSVFAYPADTMDVNRLFNGRLKYRKGAVVINMLRRYVGDSVFFAAIRNYMTDPRLAYNCAVTSDMIGHFNRASGQDLTWFFTQNIYGQGFASYAVNFCNTTIANRTPRILITQRQSDAATTFFRARVPIRFYNRTLQRDTTVRLEYTRNPQSYDLSLSFTPDSVAFDPDYDLLSGNNTIAFNNCLATNDLDNAVFLNVSPNPTNGAVQIVWAGDMVLPNAKVTISDALGRNIYEEKFSSFDPKQSIQVNLSEQTNGVFWLKIASDAGVFTRKIVKAN